MLIYVDPCKWPSWVLLYERARGISFTSMALSPHTFMPLNAFCLDVEKPSVDWHVLQMSVFFVNVLTCNLCSFCTNIIRSFEVRVTELEEQTPKRIICYCSYSSCSTDYSKLASLYPSFSLFSFFSLSSSVCFEEAQTQSCMSKRNTSM